MPAAFAQAGASAPVVVAISAPRRRFRRFRAVSATALPYVKHSFWAGHDGHRCHDPPGLSSMLIETSRSLPPLGTPRAVGRFASRQEHPPERMAPQLFVLPRTAPVPPVLPGEPAYHAQPCRLALPPEFRIARPPRIVCPQPCISLPLARHPHISLLTGDHARLMVPVKLPRLGSAPSAPRCLSYSARQPACLSPSSSANIGSPHTSQLFIALPPTGRYLKPSQVAAPPTTTPPRRDPTIGGGASPSARRVKLGSSCTPMHARLSQPADGTLPPEICGRPYPGQPAS